MRSKYCKLLTKSSTNKPHYKQTLSELSLFFIQEHPDLIKDQFWDDIFPEIPYTLASEDTKIEPVIGAAANIEVSESGAEFLPL